MPFLARALEALKARMQSNKSHEQEVYVVFGRQSSPFPSLEYIEPIIAITASEADCYALEKKYDNIGISWETRRVRDSVEHVVVDGDILYFAHSTLEPYDEDCDGNLIFGIMQSPSPTDAFRSREAAVRETPNYYLHKVVVGEVDIRGVGELFDD